MSILPPRARRGLTGVLALTASLAVDPAVTELSGAGEVEVRVTPDGAAYGPGTVTATVTSGTARMTATATLTVTDPAVIPQERMRVVSVDSEETAQEDWRAANLLDGDRAPGVSDLDPASQHRQRPDQGLRDLGLRRRGLRGRHLHPGGPGDLGARPSGADRHPGRGGRPLRAGRLHGPGLVRELGHRRRVHGPSGGGADAWADSGAHARAYRWAQSGAGADAQPGAHHWAHRRPGAQPDCRPYAGS